MTSRSERQPWEYESGPDVDITSEPRAEEQPGVPRVAPLDEPPPQPEGSDDAEEEREVRAEDPSLSPETNERVTAELREVVRADRVRVPKDRPRATRGEHPEQHGMAAYLSMHRFQIVRNTAIALTFGAIVALATGTWWLLPLAAGVHAVGTMTVALTTIRMTTISESPSAELGAALSAEGISNPDEYFSRMVEEFRTQPERGASEVLSPGFNERTVDAETNTPEADAEQSSAMTPTAQPSESGGEGGTPDYLIWTTAGSLFLLSIVLPAVMGGGWLWLLTAVMVPLVIGWVLMQRLMMARSEKARVDSRSSMVVIVVSTAIAVAAFCAVVAFAFQH
jgi:hypothetical protein